MRLVTVIVVFVLGIGSPALGQAPGLPPIPPTKQRRPQRNADGLLLLRLGRRIVRDGDYAAAVRILRRAVALLPGFALAHLELGAALAREGRRLSAARKAIENARRLMPTSGRAHAELAFVLELEGKRRAALASYVTAAKLRPHDAALHERMGLAALRLGNETLAASALKQALEFNRASTVAISNLARIYEKQRNLTASEKMLRRLLDLDPKRWPLWDRLAQFYLRHGRIAAAEQALAQVRRLNPPPIAPRTDLRELRPMRVSRRRRRRRGKRRKAGPTGTKRAGRKRQTKKPETGKGAKARENTARGKRAKAKRARRSRPTGKGPSKGK